MLPGRIRGVGSIELRTRSPLVNTTDAQRKEPLSVGPDEPHSLALLLNRKARVVGEAFGGVGECADTVRQGEHGQDAESGVLQQLAEGEFQLGHQSVTWLHGLHGYMSSRGEAPSSKLQRNSERQSSISSIQSTRWSLDAGTSLVFGT